MDNQAVALRIKTMRMSRGLSQADLAKIVGCGQSTIAMWETGKRIPSWEAVESLADALNVPTSAIIEGERPDEDKELWELRESLRRNPDLHVLFSLTKNASPKVVKQAVAIVRALQGDEYDE